MIENLRRNDIRVNESMDRKGSTQAEHVTCELPGRVNESMDRKGSTQAEQVTCELPETSKQGIHTTQAEHVTCELPGTSKQRIHTTTNSDINVWGGGG